jgi:cell division protein FtsW
MGRRTRVKKGRNTQTRLYIDVPMVIIVACLLVFGMLVLYSASWGASWQEFADVNYYFLRQLRWLGLGVVTVVGFFLVDYHLWEKKRLAVIAGVVTVLALFVVLAFGEGGRALIAGRSIQPSELAKLVVVIYLAVWLNAKQEVLKQFSFGLFPLGMILGLFGFLIFMQPDVSAAFTVVFLGLLMFFLAGGTFSQIVLAILGTGSLGSLMVFILKPSAIDRVIQFWIGIQNLAEGPPQVRAAVSAFREGGWFGVGPGRGITKLVMLPVPHTDSIFAVVGEEWGVFGATILVVLYGLFLWRGLKISRRAVDGLGSLMAAGLTLWIVFEAFVNMAVIIGLLPVAGNPLPFISLGGSNLIVSLAAVGLILNIGRAAEEKRNELKRRAVDKVVDLRGRYGRRSVSRPGRSASPS